MRIKRGNLNAEKEDNRWYVMLDDELDTEPTADPQAELVDELRRQNEYLRQQLDIRTEELRRKDHIMAALTERLPLQLEPPGEPRESSESDEPRSDRGIPPEEPEAGTQRPWWRRWFGG